MTDTGVTKVLDTSDGTDEKQLLRDREMKFERSVIDLDDIDADASTRNQARLLPVHQDTVEMYRAAMEAGDKFPPIVVNATKKPYVILDGNHRLFAAKMAGFTAMEALLVHNATKAQMELFTYEANAKHGLPTTLNERIQQGLYLVSLGNQAIVVAKALSIPEKKLWYALSAARTQRRLEKHGFDASQFSPYLLRRIGAIKSDNVVVPFAELAIKAKLGSDEINDAITTINQMSTEPEQIAYVEQLRTRLEPVINATAGGALELPPDIVRLRMAARLLRNIDANTLQESIDRTAPEFRKIIAREVVESVSTLLLASKILGSHG